VSISAKVKPMENTNAKATAKANTSAKATNNRPKRLSRKPSSFWGGFFMCEN
jgi:hypothetical protein